MGEFPHLSFRDPRHVATAPPARMTPRNPAMSSRSSSATGTGDSPAPVSSSCAARLRTFTRSWSYWTVEITGGSLPHDAAVQLHESGPRGVYGPDSKAVRVDGHCGSPAPYGPVTCWHVDTADGLRAVVLALRSHLRSDQLSASEWWPSPPPTLDIVDAALATGAPSEAADRGWLWARATRDACVRESSLLHAAWHRAAEVCAAVVVYHTRLQEVAHV